MNNKKGKSMITLIIILIIVIAICVAAYFIITKMYENKLNTGNKDTNSKEEEVISNEPLYTLDNYPKVDASLATQPLTNAFIKNFVGEDVDVTKLDYTNTHPGYVRLINDEVDLIVVTEPSKEELELAKQKGVELEVIPVVKEGFVFYVNAENKIESLTKDQIQGIYSGEITNWKQVGGEDMEKTIDRIGDFTYLEYTKDVMQIMTDIRKQWGMTYPEEEK